MFSNIPDSFKVNFTFDSDNEFVKTLRNLCEEREFEIVVPDDTGIPDEGVLCNTFLTDHVHTSIEILSTPVEEKCKDGTHYKFKGRFIV